ncbi:MAG: methyltransferase domain-containing protein [Alistipes sp.]|nr:methyltransferase domain-containing protein [Alistipes sp.]
MKRLVKFLLNTFPRPLLQRLAGAGVPLLGLLYAGRGRECPVCGCRRRKFLPYGYVSPREDALCPRCLSLERHRLLWLWLTRETDIAAQRPALLHIAPEASLMKRFSKIYAPTPERYVTADLESPLAKMHFDIKEIPIADESFDFVICNHIMEHIDDDRRAMREVLRVMKHGARGVILSPVDPSRAETFEDDSVTDPAERTRIFGQYDHRRIYGRDYADRLRSAGFEVEEIDYAATLTREERRRYALSDESIYEVRRP